MPGNSPTQKRISCFLGKREDGIAHATQTRGWHCWRPSPKASSSCHLPRPWASLKSKPGPCPQAVLAVPALALPNWLLSPRFIHNPVEEHPVWVPWDLLVSQSPSHTQHRTHPNFSTSIRQRMWRAPGKAELTENMNKTIGTTHHPEGFLIPGLNSPEKQRTIPCIMY